MNHWDRVKVQFGEWAAELPDEEPSPELPSKARRWRVPPRRFLLLAAVILAAAVVIGGMLGGQPAYDRSVVFQKSAAADIAAVTTGVSSAYVQGSFANGSCAAAGCLSTASATFGKPEDNGSTGVSVKISVFDSSDSAVVGYDQAVGVVKAKHGFTDISSSLSAYASLGSCFGAVAGTLGGSSAAVYCTKNNVMFGVSFDSTLASDGLQAEMPDVLGAVYSGIG